MCGEQAAAVEAEPDPVLGEVGDGQSEVLAAHHLQHRAGQSTGHAG